MVSQHFLGKISLTLSSFIIMNSIFQLSHSYVNADVKPTRHPYQQKKGTLNDFPEPCKDHATNCDKFNVEMAQEVCGSFTPTGGDTYTMNEINNTECITEDSVPVCKANVILSPATKVYTCIVKCKKGDGTHSACECYFYDSK